MAVQFIVRITDKDLAEFDPYSFRAELENALKEELKNEELNVGKVSPTKGDLASFSVIISPIIGAVAGAIAGAVAEKIIKQIFLTVKEKLRKKDTDTEVDAEVDMIDKSETKTFMTGSDKEINKLLYT